MNPNANRSPAGALPRLSSSSLPRTPVNPVHSQSTTSLDPCCPTPPLHETLNDAELRKYRFSPTSTLNLAPTASILPSSATKSMKKEKKSKKNGRIGYGFGSTTMPLGMYELNRMTRDAIENDRGMKRRRVGGNWSAGVGNEGSENVETGMESLVDGRGGHETHQGGPYAPTKRFSREDRRKSLPNFCNHFDSTLQFPLISVEI